MSHNPPTIADIVFQRVSSRTSRRVRDLVVEVGPEGVTLQGWTGSFHVKQLAQQGAREALPTARVRNAIVVHSAVVAAAE